MDADLAQFRAACTTGEGLAYVIINDDKGEHIYRYGDASPAQRDMRGYVLFTCAAPHVFIPQKADDKVALSKAVVVILANCHNPFVAEKSAQHRHRLLPSELRNSHGAQLA